MELKNFVKQTLSSILEAIQEVKEEKSLMGIGLTDPNTSSGKVNFDIAVTANDEKGLKSGIKVLSLLSGNIDGEMKYKNQEISRINFVVHVPV